MADGGFDFSGLENFYDSPPVDSQAPDIFASSTPQTAVAPDPGNLSLDSWFSDLGFGTGAETATNDALYSTNTPNAAGATVVEFADGTNYDMIGRTLYDPRGNPVAVLGQNDDGTLNMADGSILDPKTGDRWDDLDQQIKGQPAGATGNGVGLPGFSSGGSKAAAQSGIDLSKLVGSLGAALTSVFAGPKLTPAQIKAQQTPLGAPSILNTAGSSVFLIGALVIGFLLLRGK